MCLVHYLLHERKNNKNESRFDLDTLLALSFTFLHFLVFRVSQWSLIIIVLIVSERVVYKYMFVLCMMREGTHFIFINVGQI